MNSILCSYHNVRNRCNHEIYMYKFFAAIVLTLFANASALAEDTIKIRPQAGIGNFDGETSHHAGFRLLLNASENKTYGLELTRMFTSEVEYIVAGIIIEQKKFGWFNTSIGTVAYFGQGRGTLNQPGLVANLGWEPDTASTIKPFVTIRYDNIFGDKTIFGYAISAGLSAYF